MVETVDDSATGTTIDNVTAGVTVSPIKCLTTTEAGGQAQFTVVLNSESGTLVLVSRSLLGE